MRVLVTGGAGYLGCHLVRLLVERGHAVRVFDRVCFAEQVAEELGALANCEFVRGDMRQLHEFPLLLEDIDAIIHLAGLSNDPSCDLDSDMAVEVNLESTGRLARRAVREGVRRFVFASSCSVYGKGVFDVLDEESPTNPLTIYAQTKLQSETILMGLKSDQFEPVIARPATLFGWSPRMRFDLAINQMTATAARNRNISVFGGGKQWRPFVHVRDAARVFADMAEAPASSVAGQVFNVGSDERNYTIIDLAQRISSLFEGVTVDVVKDDEDPRSYNVQFGKLKRTLAFESEWDVESGADEIRQYLSDESINPFSTMFFNVRRMKEMLATPVAEGGEPVAPRPVAMAPGNPALAAALGAWVAKTRDRDDVGSARVQLQRLLTAHFGRPALVVGTPASAMSIALKGLGIGPGDEVAVGAYGRIETLAALRACGAVVNFADANPDTLLPDPGAWKGVVSANTKALVGYCPDGRAGLPAYVHELAAAKGCAVIEYAPDGLVVDVPKGEFAPETVSCVGLAPMVQSGWAGGYALIASRAWIESVRPDTEESAHAIQDISATAALARLDGLKRATVVRRRIARMYRSALSDLSGVHVMGTDGNGSQSWPHLLVRFPGRDANAIRLALRAENIETAVPAQWLDAKPDGETSKRDRIVALPMHELMSDKNVREVVDALKKVLAATRE
ncbi:MAG: hypothetical protein AMXMBFR84_30860 [Candidatus Hydrogenedentota bacterium]